MMTIKSEFMAGTNIESAFQEAVRVASILTVIVEFDFNGIKCLCSPKSTVENGVNKYHKELKSDHTIKIIMA